MIQSDIIKSYIDTLADEEPEFNIRNHKLIDAKIPRIQDKPINADVQTLLLDEHHQPKNNIKEFKEYQAHIGKDIQNSIGLLKNKPKYTQQSAIKRFSTRQLAKLEDNRWQHEHDLATALNTNEFAKRVFTYTSKLLDELSFDKRLIEGYAHINVASNALRDESSRYLNDIEALCLDTKIINAPIDEYVYAFHKGANK